MPKIKHEPNQPEQTGRSRKMTFFWIVMVTLLAGNVFAVWKTADMQSRMKATDATPQAVKLQADGRETTIRRIKP